MTNAEKYLKDGVSVEEFNKELFKNCVTTGMFNYLNTNAIIEWLNEQVKPTLTEDERVILKNIDKKYSIIYRDSLGRLEVKSVEIESTIWKISMVGFNHLFKFIKNGEEYEIAELLK